MNLKLLFLGTAVIVFSSLYVSRSRTKVWGVLVGGVTFIYFGLFDITGEPLSWLLRYMTNSETKVSGDKRMDLLILIMIDLKLKLLGAWSVVLAGAVVFATLWTAFAKKKASTIVRKVFHIAIVIVFITGMSDLHFLSFCSSCTLITFVMIEVRIKQFPWLKLPINFFLQLIRVCKLGPMSNAIEKCFKTFRDEKDRGFLTLTHIYLLIGCALPLWLYPSESRSALSVFSGLISVGIGDTAASIVGYLIGRHKWNNSNKSYEGTIAAISCQILVTIWLWSHLYSSPLNSLQILSIIAVSIVTAIIEAKTNQVDNLILPLYHNISLLSTSMMTNILTFLIIKINE